MRENIKVFVEICREGVVLPEYANVGDAGMDVRAAESVVIEAGKTVLVPTGLKMAIPEGFEIQVRPRSGLSLKTSLRVANAPGTIDSGYRDEICVIMHNISDKDDCQIKKGERIAQLVLQRIPKIQFEQVSDVKSIGSDRGGGFGSTGVE